MKKDNPFTLTFGKQPSEYISRYEATETILSVFEADFPYSQSYLIEGVRGSGKTVLLTAISKRLSEHEQWIIIDLNSTRDLLEDLAMRLMDSCRKMPDLLASGFNVSVAGFGIGINGETAVHDPVSRIERILNALKKENKRILITIDEVLHDQNMRAFTSQFQIFLRKDYPLFLIMTGLYENIHAVQNDPALTFLLRTPKLHLEPLSLYQISKQYSRIFRLSEAEGRHLAELTKGYAFAFQALGMLYYEYREQEPLEQILSRLDDMLDDFVYRKIWDSLSGRERDIIRAASDRDMKVQDLCDRSGISSASFSRYRDRLIKKGIMRPTGHGHLSLLLPRFSGIARHYETVEEDMS